MQKKLHSSRLEINSQRVAKAMDWAWLLLMAGLGFVYFLNPLPVRWLDVQQLKGQLTGLGSLAPVQFGVLAAVSALLGVPRLLVYSVGGMVFGFLPGLFWSCLGSLSGSYLIFCMTRQRGGRFALNRFPALRPHLNWLNRHGIMTVIMARQLPLNTLHNTVLLSLSAVSHRDFLLGSLLGFLPLGSVASLVGAGLLGEQALLTGEYALAALAVAIGGGVKLAHSTRRQPE